LGRLKAKPGSATTCQHPNGCEWDNQRIVKGWCLVHYYRIRKTGEPGPAGESVREAPVNGGKCKHSDGCLRDAEKSGWCSMHYSRLRSFGEVGEADAMKERRPDRYVKPDGYAWVWSNGRRIQEHRLVMQRILGRPLRDFENVHHKNGIRSDNDPSNLELWVKPQVPGQRAVDLAEWILETYPELVVAALSERPQLRLIR
jgi:hypothetical protein